MFILQTTNEVASLEEVEKFLDDLQFEVTRWKTKAEDRKAVQNLINSITLTNNKIAARAKEILSIYTNA